MIEYILVIGVSVILILGLIQRMYQPMDAFLKGLMGDYVACLLETGELPRLGADSGASECAPPAFSGDGPMSPPTPSTASKDNSKNKADKSTDDSDKADDGSSDGSSKNSASNRSGDGSGSRKSVVLGARGGTGNLDGGAGGGKRIEIALEGGGAGSFFKSGAGGGASSIYQKRDKYLAVTGGLGDEVKKRQEKEDAKTSTAKAEGPDSRASRKKLAVQPPPSRNVANTDLKVDGFSIGDIVKYLLIAGIIIVLFVLIGGQALQLSKSWEKGE